MGEDWREALGLPKKLRDYAACVKDMPRRVASRWNPIETSAMCQIVWYVKKTTHSYHDEQVSALIGAVLEKSYYPDALKRWRSNHAQDIRAFGDLDILPWFPRPLRSK
jgi:hypothetical protein